MPPRALPPCFACTIYPFPCPPDSADIRACSTFVVEHCIWRQGTMHVQSPLTPATGLILSPSTAGRISLVCSGLLFPGCEMCCAFACAFGSPPAVLRHAPARWRPAGPGSEAALPSGTKGGRQSKKARKRVFLQLLVVRHSFRPIAFLAQYCRSTCSRFSPHVLTVLFLRLFLRSRV
jgi:hypothetical protein